MEELTGYALLGVEDAPSVTEALAAVGEPFSLRKFAQEMKPRDELDEALQPVFQILARDFPEHRLVVTPAGATLEETREVGSYVYFEGFKSVLEEAAQDENSVVARFAEMLDEVTSSLLRTVQKDSRPEVEILREILEAELMPDYDFDDLAAALMEKGVRIAAR